MTPTDPEKPETPGDRTLPPLVLAGLFVLALGVVHLRTGPAPTAWLDTYNDERLVRACLDHGQCSLEGVAASQRDVMHANGWILLRTLWEWTGLDLHGALLLVEATLAATLVLAVWLATRLGGRVAGALALSWLATGMLGLRLDALYNSSLVPFLGGVQLLAATAFVGRPSVRGIVLAASVAAVSANVHSQCATAAITVAWLALAAPARRATLAAAGLATFAVATFALAPVGWAGNAQAALARLTHGAPHGDGGAHVPSWGNVPWLTIGVLALVLVGRSPGATALRTRLRGPIAVAVPPIAAFVALGALGVTDTDAKYLLFTTCAVSVLFAVAGWAWLEHLARGRPWLRAWTERARARPAALAAVLAVGLSLGDVVDPQRGGESLLVEDVEEAGADLRARGWDGGTMLANTTTTDVAELLEGWAVLHASWFEPWPAAEADPRTRAIVLRTDAARPADWPSGWRWHARGGGALAVAFVETGLDLRALDACVTTSDDQTECVHTSMRRSGGLAHGEASYPISGVPLMRSDVRRLRVRVPWSPGPEIEAIHMPRVASACAGRVTAVPAGGAIDEGGADARLAGEAGVVELTWEVGAGCPFHAIRGRPPLFVSGTPDEVALLASLLREAP